MAVGGLLQATLDAHLEYDAAGLLKAGLETLAQEECFQKGRYVECDEGRHAHSAELCSILECRGIEFQDLLLHISYLYSIDHLWNQPGWRPREKPTGVYPGRPAAGMLFFWSFLWPHIKLVLMHLFFYLPLPPRLRRNGNFWLAFWGKWSLADVLVMACVLALFNLDAQMSLVALWQHLEPGFGQLCDAFCLTSYQKSIAGIDFHNRSQPLPPSNCSTACLLARTALDAEVTPSSLPHSDLHVNLKMEGLAAMYAFCVAVLISLSTGVWIDSLDDALREGGGTAAQGKRGGDAQDMALSLHGPRNATPHSLPEAFPGASTTSSAPSVLALAPELADSTPSATRADGPLGGTVRLDGSPGSGSGSSTMLTHGNGVSSAMPPACDGPRGIRAALRARLLGAGGAFGLGGGGDVSAESSGDSPLLVHHIGRRPGDRERVCLCMHAVLVLVQLVLVVGAFMLPAFERVVEGSMAKLLLDAGVDFTSYISMWSLPAMVARDGGLDYLMAATFTLFIVIAPVLRGLTLLALLLLPMQLSTARRLYVHSRRIVSYTALDVMLIATPLIGMAFGPMSEILLNDQTFAPCGMLDHIYGTGEICMRIDVIPTTGYWFNVAAVAIYLLSGFDGSPTSKFIHRRLFPLDPEPPPGCKCA